MERRARADQRARRVNTAVELLASGLTVVEASQRLAQWHRISRRHARRYVERARDEGPVEVPTPKIVFTVKLPTELVRRLRRYTRAKQWMLSTLVSRAVQEFLDRVGANRQGGSG